MSFDGIERRDMTLIRPLPGNHNPPLDHTNRSRVPYGQIIERMQVTGFHRWGLLILRATYTDHAKWDAFLERIRTSAENTMTRKALGLPHDEATPALLLPLLRWDVLEDREALEATGVEGARRRFAEWRAGASVERDGEGADSLCVRLGFLARYRYFVMVDDVCLVSLTKGEGNGKSELNGPPVKVRVVDAGPVNGVDHLLGAPTENGATVEVGQGQDDASAANEGSDGADEEDEDSDEVEEEQFPPVEGSTEWDVGWMWVDSKFLLGFYDILQADSGWDLFYERPPKVYGRR